MAEAFKAAESFLDLVFVGEDYLTAKAFRQGTLAGNPEFGTE